MNQPDDDKRLKHSEYRLSRGFVSALVGAGVTLLAWYGPWEWPAWPAFSVIEIVYGSHSAFADQPYATRAAAVVALILVNVGAWAALASVAAALARSFRDRRTVT